MREYFTKRVVHYDEITGEMQAYDIFVRMNRPNTNPGQVTDPVWSVGESSSFDIKIIALR